MNTLTYLYKSLQAKTTLWTLSLLRLCLGLVSFLWLISNLPHLSRDYSLNGMMQLMMTATPTWGWKLMSSIPGHETTLFALGIFLHIVFLHGRFAQSASLALWAWHKCLISINAISMNSEQYMFMWMFLYGAFMPWSTNSKIFDTEDKRDSLALRLFQVHVCLIYAISTYWKIKLDPAWFHGESVAYVLMHPLWSKVSGQEWIVLSGLPQVLTYSSLILEGSFAIFVWYPFFRRFFVFSLLIFHFCLGLFFMRHIGFFTMAMMTALLAWSKPEDFFKLNGLVPRLKLGSKSLK